MDHIDRNLFQMALTAISLRFDSVNLNLDSNDSFSGMESAVVIVDDDVMMIVLLASLLKRTSL